jgi:hypothetical protein
VLIASTVSASDSATVQASEGSVLIASTVSIADSAGVGSTESVLVTATVSVSDGLSVSVTESPSIAVTTSATDSCTAQATENASVTVTLSVTDAITVQAVEGVPTIDTGTTLVAKGPVADSCELPTTEAAALVQPIAINAADSITVQAVESVQSGPQLLSAQEALSLSLVENTTNALATAASDAAQLPASDVAAILLAQFAIDAAQLPIVDIVTFAGEPPSIAFLSVSDACAITLEERATSPVVPAEIVAMLLLESVTVQKTDLQDYWGGGARLEDASQIYATSVRTGPLPPDQSRGGTW